MVDVPITRPGPWRHHHLVATRRTQPATVRARRRVGPRIIDGPGTEPRTRGQNIIRYRGRRAWGKTGFLASPADGAGLASVGGAAGPGVVDVFGCVEELADAGGCGDACGDGFAGFGSEESADGGAADAADEVSGAEECDVGSGAEGGAGGDAEDALVRGGAVAAVVECAVDAPSDGAGESCASECSGACGDGGAGHADGDGCGGGDDDVFVVDGPVPGFAGAVADGVPVVGDEDAGVGEGVDGAGEGVDWAEESGGVGVGERVVVGVRVGVGGGGGIRKACNGVGGGELAGGGVVVAGSQVGESVDGELASVAEADCAGCGGAGGSRSPAATTRSRP